ncbi:protein IRON-RELATED TRANSCRIPTION FACTOR 3-like [Curcuma longa]|uniref:protein IRON-RELATED TRANSCRIPTION FACTOR 3-like n=1 Tax=Curcuma longa TaxID=136217 RepID=UPI003D9EE050
MVTESPIANSTNAGPGQSPSSSIPTKRNLKKVSKKENKSLREKKKRDYLNELFMDLAQALEPTRLNNGKAYILVETTRLLRDLVGQVETLRKENAALVTESQYVKVEKNELQEEKKALRVEVERLQSELNEMQSNSMGEWGDKLDLAPSMPVQTQQQPSLPLYDIVVQQDFNSLQDAGCSPTSAKAPTPVSRPHARYPTPLDAWPLELLSRNQREAHEAQQIKCTSRSSASTISGEGMPGK